MSHAWSRLLLCLGLVMVAFPFSACHAQAEVKQFRAGAATSNITPALGISIAGHMNDRKATHVHDELHARCLVLDNGVARLGFVVVDSCMVPREIVEAAKKLIHEATGDLPENITISATHSHSAACATPVFQSDPSIDYQQFLCGRIADGYRRAVNNLDPARIGWGVGQVPDEVHCRRWKMKPETIGENPFGVRGETVVMNPPRMSPNLIEPAGPTDPDVSFLAVQAHDGRPIALLANYSLHYVGGEGPGHVSADYFAIFANHIETLLRAEHQDPPFVGIMSNGTSGNINNIDFQAAAVEKKPYEQMTAVADKVAQEVCRAYQTIAFQDWVALGSVYDDIELGVRLPNDADVKRAHEILASASGDNLTTLPQIYAGETVKLKEYPVTVPVRLQTFRIGELAVPSIPCEVFAEIGLGIKQRSPFKPTFIIELANGYNGYLPTAAQHGFGGYETWRARSSYLEVHAADRIIETIIRQLESLHAQP